MSFPYFICVPHQKPAFIDWSPELVANQPEDDRDPNDNHIVGDHDFHCVHMVESVEDAKRLVVYSDSKGGQARHQAIAIARLAKEILEEEGVAVS